MNNKIKQIRLSKNLTQQQLAEKIGVNQKDISRWETGERNPKLDKLKLIAEALECKLDDLI